MDIKKQMYLRLFFSRTFSKKMNIDIIQSISQHMDTAEIVQAPESKNGFFVTPVNGIDKKIDYNNLFSSIVADYVRSNYVIFRRLYDEFAYENKEFKDSVTKDDIQILLDSDNNNFVFNILFYNGSLSVSFG